MNLRYCLVIAMVGLTYAGNGVAAAASPTAQADDANALRWVDVSEMEVEGKGWHDTKAFYDRLPAKAEGVVRGPVWSLSRHSAGLSVRFRTDAPSIDVRWELISKRLALPHMPATGVSGVDLYVRTDAGWHWLATGQPRKQVNSVRLASNLAAKVRDYWLYLPLYNGVSRVEVGVPPESSMEKSSPRDASLQRPIVFWGTSITQGGCTSRPGMVHTAILGRRLNHPVINLGFSGNGRMEPEVAQLIAEIDAAVYVIDCLPNLTGAEVTERVERVVEILRKARPTTPILLVEDRTYADAFLVAARRQRNTESRAALKAAYQRMVAAGVKDLHYLPGDHLLGEDGEDTVDGSHLTDLGFFRQAAAFERALRPVLAGASR
ncbi:MAG: SGNH/GDSL hydrolase family protein [Pirellulales bacterium]